MKNKEVEFKVNKILLITLVILGCLTMAFVDGVLSPNYITKSICKLLIFLLLPYIYYSRSYSSISLKSLFKINKDHIIKSFALGIAIYILILSAYFTIGNLFNFSSVTKSLENNIGVNTSNFIFVALYISFINSLLEEVFFRGFAFITLKNISSKKFAYIFSSISFSIYHVAMMSTWFDIVLLLLLILSLFIAGIFFNYLDDKNNNIYNSWFVHMFANFAINTIGFILFGII
ncbi:CPBP family intramembrane glutamic endopeptidase [Terrisporobacter glycolicus]|uniref:CAAX prenyl protease 2/Lysostaphin resistance protein A-like domain-containing protein n=1 Tax=Terrisporobacter glycolicus ATCC 14880 = DSM 1288 TaxID=1121315 RepID=A0ABZ2EUP4_9FIRM|nr:type II CAAX endopeptidase family protein [Terrisporobacter glycolicus]